MKKNIAKFILPLVKLSWSNTPFSKVNIGGVSLDLMVFLMFKYGT